MQETSELYKRLLQLPHRMEVSLTIGDSGNLIDEYGNEITFGGDSIMVSSSGPDSGYGEDMIIQLDTTADAFSESMPIGNCISQTIDIKMIKPLGTIPRMARLAPYIRLVGENETSEWIRRGVFFIDTREETTQKGAKILSMKGFDSMLKAETAYPPSTLGWPATDIEVVHEIAKHLQIQVDERTEIIMNKEYGIQYPAEYSCREVLGYIAAAYGGNFVISDMGELLLLAYNSMPPETSYLTTEDGTPIEFGGVLILV